MLDAVRFVRGAVAKKDFVPELTHFRIEDGRITGFNGVIALSSPINLELTARPKAVPFANALARCEDVTTMHLTQSGRLSIKSGKFRALVDCIPNDDASLIPTAPDGVDVDLGDGFMSAVRALDKFQGIDASRVWAMGILFLGQSAYATNNVVFAQYWHGHNLPMRFQIPAAAVAELLRINTTPLRVTATDTTATFHFDDGRWLRTALVAETWPDGALALLDRPFNYGPVPAGLFDGLASIKPFIDTDERVFFRGGAIHTSASDEVGGAAFEVPGLPDGPCFAFKVLNMLDGITSVDFSPHPNPCGFTAENMRGMFLGLRT